MKFEATLVMMEPMSRYSAPGLTTCQTAVYEWEGTLEDGLF